MSFSWVECIGFLAGGICATALFPQIYKCAKTRQTEHLSYGMLSFNFTGVFLYLVYGICLSKPAIWVNMCVSETATMVLIGQKFYYERMTHTQKEIEQVSLRVDMPPPSAV
jgi:MtN3 and saliva related transmembrane protein